MCVFSCVCACVAAVVLALTPVANAADVVEYGLGLCDLVITSDGDSYFDLPSSPEPNTIYLETAGPLVELQIGGELPVEPFEGLVYVALQENGVFEKAQIYYSSGWRDVDGVVYDGTTTMYPLEGYVFYHDEASADPDSGETTPTDNLTMSQLLERIGEVFNTSVGWVGAVTETVANNPLLLFGVVAGFIGLGVGLFKRLLQV